MSEDLDYSCGQSCEAQAAISPERADVCPAAEAPQHALQLEGPVSLGQFQPDLLQDEGRHWDPVPDRRPRGRHVGVQGAVQCHPDIGWGPAWGQALLNVQRLVVMVIHFNTDCLITLTRLV